jgi:hypothetical protein
MTNSAGRIRTLSRSRLSPRAAHDLLCFWRFCGNARCARSRECRGKNWPCSEAHWRFLSRREQAWYYRRIGRHDLLS